MATATKARSRKSPRIEAAKSVNSNQNPDPKSTQISPLLTQVSREQEPLENAARRREAPEAWQSRRTDAPDAGRGSECSEHDTFTQGRSMS
jgi:hypothetical protein